MIIALVTLYYPDLKVIENVKSIALQSDIVYLCDNSPHNNITMFDKIENVVYKFFNANLGLSAAFNMILRNGTFNNDDFVIFFDQDSHIKREHIQLLIEEYQKLEKQKFEIGCLNPIYLDITSKKYIIPTYKKQISDKTFIVQENITSSMLCKFKTLKAVNFWNEDIFLDMSDYDLCWRLIKNKKLCFITKAVHFEHTIGENDYKILFTHLREGKPFRLYYQIRDGLKLFFKEYVPMQFRLRFIMKLTLKQMLNLIFLKHKQEYINYYFKGIIDWIKHKKGEI